MNRVLPEQVVEAFRHTGLKPMQGDFFPIEGCACGLGAIFTYLCKDKNEDVAEWCENEYGDDYVQAFAAGFDGSETSIYREKNKSAYNDGKSSWELAKEKLLLMGDKR